MFYLKHGTAFVSRLISGVCQTFSLCTCVLHYTGWGLYKVATTQYNKSTPVDNMMASITIQQIIIDGPKYLVVIG